MVQQGIVPVPEHVAGITGGSRSTVTQSGRIPWSRVSIKACLRIFAGRNAAACELSDLPDQKR